MTWRPRLAWLLPALLLAGCGGDPARPRQDPVDWKTLLREGDGLGAEVALRQAAAQGAAPAMLRPYFGEAALLQGDLEKAERALTGEGFAPAVAGHGFHMLGRLRMAQGDLGGAGRAFDAALGTAANSAGLWVDIGRLRWRGGEQAEAVAASEKALALGPKDPAALLFRAQLVRDSLGNAAALPLFQRGLEVAPDDPGLLGDFAATLGELGRNADMLRVVRKLAEVAPGDHRVLWLQAVLAARAGRYDLARSLLQRSREVDRDSPAAIMLLAIIDLDNNNYGSAAQGLDRLLRMQPDNARVAMLLARALALGGNDRELAARFADNADGAYSAMLVGRAYEALGEREKAAAFLDRAMQGDTLRLRILDPGLPVDSTQGRVDDGPRTVALVRHLLGEGHSAAALERAEAFLALHPGSADALALAGDAALGGGNAGKALDYYRKAAGVRRPWPLAKRMVAALDRSGDPAGATGIVREHVRAEPGNADAALLLARRLHDRGRPVEASALVNLARTFGRNDPLIDRLTPDG